MAVRHGRPEPGPAGADRRRRAPGAVLGWSIRRRRPGCSSRSWRGRATATSTITSCGPSWCVTSRAAAAPSSSASATTATRRPGAAGPGGAEDPPGGEGRVGVGGHERALAAPRCAGARRAAGRAPRLPAGRADPGAGTGAGGLHAQGPGPARRSPSGTRTCSRGCGQPCRRPLALSPRSTAPVRRTGGPPRSRRSWTRSARSSTASRAACPPWPRRRGRCCPGSTELAQGDRSRSRRLVAPRLPAGAGAPPRRGCRFHRLRRCLHGRARPWTSGGSARS